LPKGSRSLTKVYNHAMWWHNCPTDTYAKCIYSPSLRHVINCIASKLNFAPTQRRSSLRIPPSIWPNKNVEPMFAQKILGSFRGGMSLGEVEQSAQGTVPF
jgi:hypothetical protein